MASATVPAQQAGSAGSGSSGHDRPPAAVATAAVLVAVASLCPVAYLLLREGFSLRLLAAELASPSTPELIAHTFVLTGTVCVASLVLGLGLAVLVVRTDLPAARLWVVVLTMPLAVPGFVSSYTWLAASLRFFPTSDVISGLSGSTLVLGLGLYPYVFLPAVTALRAADAAQEEAARALGRSAAGAFWSATLPQLRTALCAGLLIVALHVLAEFGALQLLSYQTLTTAIMSRIKVLGAPEAARALSIVLVVAAVLVLVAERLVRGRASRVRVGGGVIRPPTRWPLGRARAAWTVLTVLVALLALGVPLYVAVTGLTRALTAPAGARSAVAWDTLAHAGLTTCKLALAAAVVGTLVALPVSWLTARHPGALATLTERAVWTAHALPGVIMALALVFIGIHWMRPLYQTSAMLVGAYVILYLPLAVGSQHVGFRSAAREFDEIAHSLRAGRLATVRRVVLPLAAPGIAAGGLLMLLDAAKELTTTLMLVPTGTNTLTTALWQTTNGEVLDFTTAAPYGAALILIGVLPAYLLARRTLQTLH